MNSHSSFYLNSPYALIISNYTDFYMVLKTPDRYQTTYLPKTIEDFVSKDDPVRANEVMIDTIGDKGLGLARHWNKVGNSPNEHDKIVDFCLFTRLDKLSENRKSLAPLIYIDATIKNLMNETEIADQEEVNRDNYVKMNKELCKTMVSRETMQVAIKKGKSKQG